MHYVALASVNMTISQDTVEECELDDLLACPAAAKGPISQEAAIDLLSKFSTIMEHHFSEVLALFV